MRDIVFRGKQKDYGEWLIGDLMRSYDSKYWIVTHDTEGNYASEIISETVGQFTGLFDKNGKRIFEGDVIELERGWDEKVRYIVEYDTGICSFIGDSINYIGFTTFENDGGHIEVVGNIQDNPELLKGE